MELKIVEMPISELVPYEGNAKLHPHFQIDMIADSIADFGDCDPIGAWHDQDGNAVIVEGHGRYMALKKLGIETAPVIFLDHLDDEGRRAYGLAHNQLTMNSGFDSEVLQSEIDDLLPEIDMERYGFDTSEPLDLSQFDTDILNKSDKASKEQREIVCECCGVTILV